MWWRTCLSSLRIIKRNNRTPGPLEPGILHVSLHRLDVVEIIRALVDGKIGGQCRGGDEHALVAVLGRADAAGHFRRGHLHAAIGHGACGHIAGVGALRGLAQGHILGPRGRLTTLDLIFDGGLGRDLHIAVVPSGPVGPLDGLESAHEAPQGGGPP